MAALSKTQRRKRRLGIVGDVYAILIYTVLYIPVAVMMVFSFNDQKYNFYWNASPQSGMANCWRTTPSSAACGTP